MTLQKLLATAIILDRFEGRSENTVMLFKDFDEYYIVELSAKGKYDIQVELCSILKAKTDDEARAEIASFK